MATRTLRCSVCDLEWGYSGHSGCGLLFADGRREYAHPIADGSAECKRIEAANEASYQAAKGQTVSR